MSTARKKIIKDLTVVSTNKSSFYSQLPQIDPTFLPLVSLGVIVGSLAHDKFGSLSILFGIGAVILLQKASMTRFAQDSFLKFISGYVFAVGGRAGLEPIYDLLDANWITKDANLATFGR